MAKKTSTKSAKGASATPKSKKGKSSKSKSKTVASKSTKTRTAKAPKSKSAAEPAELPSTEEASDAGLSHESVTIDRREGDRRQVDSPVASDRRKVQRRRQIDPTTCERDYSGDEIEFMQALDEYKRSSGRMFPTCSEILEVIRDLGYVRLDEFGNPVAPIASAASDETEESEDSEELASCDS